MNNKFENLGLSSQVVKSIAALGYDTPSPIQEGVIPLIMDNYDVIGQAQTGTGKTLAYAGAILSKIDVKKNIVQSIILAPTRELAMQVCEEFKSLNKSKEFDILAVYGGDSIDRQIKALKKGADVVVGTPGRVLDLMRRKVLDIKSINFFVLDEADEMLNMGFLEDIESVLKETNDSKQVLMLSATMPKEIKKLAKNYMREDFKQVTIKADSLAANTVKQSYYVANDKHRTEVLCRILDFKKLSKTIIFCQTKKQCDELLGDLQKRGYSSEAMHGDIAQANRMKTLDRFKDGSFNFLIATDVAARGIHVDNIDLVINFSLPREFESYIHRIGRTGRANSKGEAISIITPKERSYMKRIEKEAKCEITEGKVPEGEEIVENKFNSILADVKIMIDENKQEKALKYVRDLNKGDLINLSAALLKTMVDKELGSNIYKKLEVKERTSNKNVDKNKTRVFINIGKKDNLKKGSLLDFAKKETGVDKDDLTNIEILSTFTFIDIKDKSVKEFMKKIKGKTFGGRQIRVEISNKSKKNK